MKQTLKAMILEVNNTFDERRMYLLQQAASESGSKFRNSWKKDFHVSPFNDREGGYLLVAIDPFARMKSSSDGTAASIDNTITLSSPAPDTKAKLVARVNSIAPPIDPTRLSSIEKAKFMLRWCWSGFLTNPRILVEARVLWTKKKLQLFYRPEVNTGSIGRQESQEEVILERAFRHWLTAVAEESNITVAYTSAAGVQRGHRHALPGNRRLPLTLGPDEADFDLEVLTPEWYAELARARDLRETFARRYSAAQSGDRMVIVNNYGQTILKGGLDRAIERRRTRTNSSVQETMRRAAADHLRSGKNLLSCIIATFVQPLIRPVESTGDSCLTLSDFMDLTEVDGRHEIEWAAIIVLLADRLALGFTGLLKWYAKLSWYGLIFIVVHQLKRVIVA
ncbi:uncharacterized protein HMPREF1541_03302 [Cyphellophora europaea CBS 101466]|uniref:Uncharacterized protein n=1 Tax=Cyphellophora europaea (strain CBS 101466) TaxID=1220924 RepID=W2RY60_CYPE1|nr:uncharacterized protein HMPREF1541_03302 [Cyphellophora europaea CBS 101466]ETN41367.1 hypothetical protein HMPREF1541_03302 [Cyphellophora europaea CBS 101466]